MITIRDPEELQPAYARLLALDEDRKSHAVKRLERYMDFQASEEQFAEVPEQHRILDQKMVPLDIVFLINWLCVYPSKPMPMGFDRQLAYDELWDTVESTYDYRRISTRE